MVLVITQGDEPNTDEVLDYFIYNREPFIRLENGISGIRFSSDKKLLITDANEVVDLTKLKGYWYRRGDIFKKNDKGYKRFEVNELIPIYKFIEDQIKQYTKNYLGSFFGDVYINKLQVLDAISNNGVQVPEFEIITRKSDLEKFIDTYGKVITKTVFQGRVIYNNELYFIPTSFITKRELNSIQETFKPSFVQRFVERYIEVRSFYLDGRFFSGAIIADSNSVSKADSRIGQGGIYEPYCLPKKVEKSLHKSFQSLKIKTGSVDLIVDQYGNHFFLEVNPIGQFGPVSKQCGYHYEKEIYNYLTK